LHEKIKDMAKKAKKPTNKAKFSLYLDKTVMANVARQADKTDRSVNYIVEKNLEKDFA
jgi:predicted HicB family RNase H-like nuclease